MPDYQELYYASQRKITDLIRIMETELKQQKGCCKPLQQPTVIWEFSITR